MSYLSLLHIHGENSVKIAIVRGLIEQIQEGKVSCWKSQGQCFHSYQGCVNFRKNIPVASFTSILPTADFILFLHKTANQINWQRKNDGRVLFCTDAGQRLQIPQLKVSANIMQCLQYWTRTKSVYLYKICILLYTRITYGFISTTYTQ